MQFVFAPIHPASQRQEAKHVLPSGDLECNGHCEHGPPSIDTEFIPMEVLHPFPHHAHLSIESLMLFPSQIKYAFAQFEPTVSLKRHTFEPKVFHKYIVCKNQFDCSIYT